MMNRNILRKVRGYNFAILFIVFYFISIFPFFPLTYIPFHDLPQQLVPGVVIKEKILGGDIGKNFYISNFFISNTLAWLIIALLNIFFDILTTSKIFIFLYFLLTPLSLYYYLDEDKKWMVFLSFIFLNNFSLNMGYMNFILSISLLFFALGALKKDSNFFYIFSFLLFLSHALTYAIFIFIIPLFYKKFKEQKKKFIFSVLLFCFIILSLCSSKGQSVDDILYLLKPTSIVMNLVHNTVFSIPCSFQFFRPDYVGLMGFIVVMSLYAKQLFWSFNYDKKTLYITLFLLFLLFFMPNTIPIPEGKWYVFTTRITPLIIFFTITDLRLDKRFEKGLLLLFLFLTFFNSLTLLPVYKETDRRLTNQYEPIIKKLPPGGSIYLLDGTDYEDMGFRMSKYTYGLSPFEHYFSGYYSIKGGFSSEYFGGYYSIWPIKYVTNFYYPICEENITKICVWCEKQGIQCYIKENETRVGQGYMENETIRCIYCPRSMWIKCYQYNKTENASKKKRFTGNENCIPCSKEDVRCFLNNTRVIENFDYLVVFSDNVNKYKINDSIYASTEDVIVYEV